MNVIGISASPRRGGNSEILLDRALEGATSAGADTEKIVLNELNFKPCQECGGCDKTGICIIRDDMDGVYEKLRSADIVIVSSPIFFASLSAQAKMMIDRFQCSWVSKYVLNNVQKRKKRKGFLISVAGVRKKDYFENAKQIIKTFFATLDIEYGGELFCEGMDKMEGIKSHNEFLDKAYAMGRGTVKI